MNAEPDARFSQMEDGGRPDTKIDKSSFTIFMDWIVAKKLTNLINVNGNGKKFIIGLILRIYLCLGAIGSGMMIVGWINFNKDNKSYTLWEYIFVIMFAAFGLAIENWYNSLSRNELKESIEESVKKSIEESIKESVKKGIEEGIKEGIKEGLKEFRNDIKEFRNDIKEFRNDINTRFETLENKFEAAQKSNDVRFDRLFERSGVVDPTKQFSPAKRAEFEKNYNEWRKRQSHKYEDA